MAHILYVDDEEPVRLILQDTLERIGHTAVCASNAAEATDVPAGPRPNRSPIIWLGAAVVALVLIVFLVSRLLPQPETGATAPAVQSSENHTPAVSVVSGRLSCRTLA